jgi:16S rRNA (cytidine1402-2'-O)-methyltransferase
MTTGTLFVVSTPIGNLKDITFRAIEILKSAAFVIAEDTRTTAKLFNHYEITSKMISYHKFNEKERESEVISLLINGQNVALVSDAGTPLMSDPGYTVVKAAIDAGIKVETIPGPSSLLSALILSGFDPSRFVFYGFIDKTEKGRADDLRAISGFKFPVIVFESPNRVKDTLAEISKIMPQRQAAVSKELTKIYETVFRGTPDEIIGNITQEMEKGEFIIVIGPAPAEEKPREDQIEDRLKELSREGMTMSEAVKTAAQELNTGRNEVYKISLKLKKEV